MPDEVLVLVRRPGELGFQLERVTVLEIDDEVVDLWRSRGRQPPPEAERFSWLYGELT